MVDLRKYPIPRVRHHVSPALYHAVDDQHVLPAWYPPTIDVAAWTTWFGNGSTADVLDIGCGRGGFLLDHATTFPDRTILGLEVRQPLVDWTNGVIDGEGYGNARALWYTVANGLDFIEPASIDYAVYLFPDPWPKKRHHKRRAFTEAFLDTVSRVLKPGGALYLATDREDVDAYQRTVLAAHGSWAVTEPMSDAEWPFPFRTDQQKFCHRKDIPYVRYAARKA